jgi:hypothetical protein
MASGRTARRLLQFYKPTDAPTLSAWSEALANQLDNDVEGGQGKLSERPPAKLRGRVFVVQGDATEANNGIVWWDTGATWLAVNHQVGAGPTVTTPGVGAEVEPSSSRAADVSVVCEGVTGVAGIVTALVGGVPYGIAAVNGAGTGGSIPLVVAASVKWKWTGSPSNLAVAVKAVTTLR